jgi:hypothetical protein
MALHLHVNTQSTVTNTRKVTTWPMESIPIGPPWWKQFHNHKALIKKYADLNFQFQDSFSIAYIALVFFVY